MNRKNKTAVVGYLALLGLALQIGPLALAQYFTGDLPRTQEEASQMIKNIDDQVIASDQPGLVYEEMRTARAEVVSYFENNRRK